MAQQWIATRPGDLDVLSFDEVEVPAPGPGEVTIEVRAAGVNPADLKHVLRGGGFPRGVGYEVAGVLTAVGPGTEVATGAGAVGDEVVAFRVQGGWATALTVAAVDVLAKPPGLGWAEAANLLLAGATAAEMLHVTGCTAGETVLAHGASGAVGVSLLQQAAARGVRVIGTASAARAGEVERFGGVPVTYGPGLVDRVRALAPDGVAAALDCVGTDEAVETSLELVADRARVVTIAAQHRAEADGIRVIGGTMPASKAFRDAVRADLLAQAADRRLVVPVARTYALADALDAARLLLTGHPGGKLALVP